MWWVTSSPRHPFCLVYFFIPTKNTPHGYMLHMCLSWRCLRIRTEFTSMAFITWVFSGYQNNRGKKTAVGKMILLRTCKHSAPYCTHGKITPALHVWELNRTCDLISINFPTLDFVQTSTFNLCLKSMGLFHNHLFFSSPFQESAMNKWSRKRTLNESCAMSWRFSYPRCHNTTLSLPIMMIDTVLKPWLSGDIDMWYFFFKNY